ncbi:hypothetical protein F5Y14DRAFT_459480 [Nemania sp. NC0429]|nr:hypothetical protein F5Y14DRAFT_459480 [Nemania sp. NC0429]
MDPIEKLFRALPNPVADRAALDQNGTWNQAHFGQVFMSFSPSRSHDLDRGFVQKLAKSFSENPDYPMLRSEIGQFALDKPEIPNDDSAKSQQLKYHAWISQGRKDEEYPFNGGSHSDGQAVVLPEGSHAFLPAELTNPKICANCKKPNPNNACSGCLVELDGHAVMKTQYCDKKCQIQHWKDHKSQCLGRKKISRAVSLIYDFFIMAQKGAWINKQIVSIIEKQGITNIVHGNPDEWAFQGKPFVCRYPSEMAPSEEHARAVLVDNECQQLLTTFQGLLKLFLMPLCQTLQEVQITPRNAHRPTCDMRHGQVRNSMYSEHTVLRATLHSGEQMAIDITGVQFGWRETVAPWKIWSSHRVAGKSCPQPFGSAQRMQDMLYPFAASQFIQLSESQRLSLAHKMELAIQKKMKDNMAPSVGELYRLDNAAFASCKQAMLSGAEEALKNGLRELHESKVGLCYIDARGEWRATTTKQQAEALEGVWLTDEDIRKAKARGTDLRVIYQMRCNNRSRKQKFKAAGLNMP